MSAETVEPVAVLILPDGRELLPERRRGGTLRRCRPPRTDPAERRRRPRDDDGAARGRTLDLLA